MNAEQANHREPLPSTIDPATRAVNTIDQILRDFNRGRWTAQAATQRVRAVLNIYLDDTFLDPLTDRPLVIDWAIDAIATVCAADPFAQREKDLFAAWLDSRLNGELAIVQVGLKLDQLAEALNRDRAMALNMLTAWCSTTAALPILVADRLIDLAHEHRQVGLLTSMLTPGGMVSSRSFPLSTTIRVLDRLAHLAHDPSTYGQEACSAMVELAVWPDLAAHVAIRLPAHLLDRSTAQHLCAVIEQWEAFNSSPEPWIAPDHIVLARLALQAALMRLADAARLSS